MMTMSDPLSAAQTEHYFDEHYSVDDYYTQGQSCIGQWIGKGPADLGLAGDVARDDFSALLQGINPRSGAVFIPAATHNQEHRAGWDSVFSAPKTVSIQALIGGDNRLIQAHSRAVERALREVEAYALSHQHGGRERVITANYRWREVQSSCSAPGGRGSVAGPPVTYACRTAEYDSTT
jgi:conjugative relaxase-like TrwC/TraI family protein